MKVVPLAAESLGVRSMATFVEVGGTGILLDPGATLAAGRFGLPPAEAEWEALRRANDRISSYATRAQIVFVSHYHEDHFRWDPATYQGRLVLAKDPRRMVQGQQARRSQELWRALGDCATVAPADGAARHEGAWTLEVSPPLPHGLEGTALGYVVALTIVDHAERERFVFASDLQGPLSPVATAWLRRQRPTLLYLSGPPSYLQHELGAEAIERGIANLLEVVAASGCRVIMDHHALRDGRWRERFAPLWATGRVQTAAGWCGAGETPLEARRRELWGALRRPAAKAGEGRAIIGRTPSGRLASRAAKGGDVE
jgi:predicted metallo-beta-lactamase superfamily hydrolase